MRCDYLKQIPASALILMALAVPNAFGQAPAALGFRGPGPGMPAMGGRGAIGGFGYGGGNFPTPNLFMPFPGGYGYGGYGYGGYGYGGYDPMVASVPSTAYLTLGNTSYTTESPSPLPVYSPRTPYAPLPSPLPLTALLQVQVPAEAEVWLEGQKMRSVGAMRHFRSPPLNPSKEYAYHVRARWKIDDKPVEDARHVAIRAGATVLVDFNHLDPLVPRPSAPAPPPTPTPAKPAPGGDAS